MLLVLATPTSSRVAALASYAAFCGRSELKTCSERNMLQNVANETMLGTKATLKVEREFLLEFVGSRFRGVEVV